MHDACPDTNNPTNLHGNVHASSFCCSCYCCLYVTVGVHWHCSKPTCQCSTLLHLCTQYAHIDYTIFNHIMFDQIIFHYTIFQMILDLFAFPPTVCTIHTHSASSLYHIACQWLPTMSIASTVAAPLYKAAHTPMSPTGPQPTTATRQWPEAGPTPPCSAANKPVGMMSPSSTACRSVRGASTGDRDDT